jgi:hypothetical protein
MTRLAEVCWLHDGRFNCQKDGTDNMRTFVVFALPDSKSPMCQELTVKYGSNTAISGFRSRLILGLRSKKLPTFTELGTFCRDIFFLRLFSQPFFMIPLIDSIEVKTVLLFRFFQFLFNYMK